MGFFSERRRDHVGIELVPGCCATTNLGQRICAALEYAVLYGNEHFSALALHKGCRLGDMV